MRIPNRAAAAGLAVAAGALAFAGPAAAKTRVVHPGESIQAAIDKSKPGDTVLVKKGTYAEELQISTNRLKLRGQKAKLTPPAAPGNNLCDQFAESPGKTTGICVVGDISGGPNGPTVNKTVKRVRISGFAVKGFSGDGVLIFGADGTRLEHVKLLDNGGYGAFSNTSSGTRFRHDLVQGNGAPGLYVGDSPKAKAVVSHNVSRGNKGEGILLRNASHGTVSHNLLRGNCAGVVVLADAPGPAGHWKVDHNLARANNEACAGDPGEGEPALSGIGIGLLGADHTRVLNNKVVNNKDLHPSFTSGGIVVQKGSGGTLPAKDLVKANRLSKNSPFDIDWDGTGTVTFKKNHCSTSNPSGLCS